MKSFLKQLKMILFIIDCIITMLFIVSTIPFGMVLGIISATGNIYSYEMLLTLIKVVEAIPSKMEEMYKEAKR